MNTAWTEVYLDNPKLAELQPEFRERVVALLEDLAKLGWKPRVASGRRSRDEQAKKVLRGVSRTMRSMHIDGLAADIIDRRYGWKGLARSHDFAFWTDLGRLAKSRGLTWGGDWRGFRDVAHIEWNPSPGYFADEKAFGAHESSDLPLWISLGGGCSVAYQLRRRHLRGTPMPFDWIRTPASALPTIIRTDLEGFLTAERLWLQQRPRPVLRERGFNVILPHSTALFLAEGAPAVEAYFTPKVAALREALNSRRHLVFVRRGISPQEAERVRDALFSRLGHRMYTLLAVDDRAHGPSTVDRSRPNILRILTSSTLASWQGCDRTWDWIFNTAMDSLLVHDLQKTAPRRLLGRDWLQVEIALDTVARRRVQTLNAVPELLIDALIVGEDHRFYAHHGIDLRASVRALLGWVTGIPRGGGSTIEQQLFRTITNRRERTLARKIRELLGAYFLADRLEKRKSAALYLTVAYFGAHMNGIDRACATLGLPLADLDETEAASLIARLKYPQPRNPTPRWTTQLQQRTAWIHKRLRAHRNRPSRARFYARPRAHPTRKPCPPPLKRPAS